MNPQFLYLIGCLSSFATNVLTSKTEFGLSFVAFLIFIFAPFAVVYLAYFSTWMAYSLQGIFSGKASRKKILLAYSVGSVPSTIVMPVILLTALFGYGPKFWDIANRATPNNFTHFILLVYSVTSIIGFFVLLRCLSAVMDINTIKSFLILLVVVILDFLFLALLFFAGFYWSILNSFEIPLVPGESLKLGWPIALLLLAIPLFFLKAVTTCLIADIRDS